MEILAIVRGALGGLALAMVIAAALAWADFHGAVSGILLTVLFWLGAGLVFLFAGLVAGRSANAGYWLHGSLAAFTLNLVGSVMAESLGRADHHLWLDLAFAAVVGMVGGIWGRFLAD